MGSASKEGGEETSTHVPGNYVGGTYKGASEGGGDVADGPEVRRFEGQFSELSSQPGGMLLDYLRATVPDQEGVREALRGFLGVFTDRGRGWRGWYDSSAEVLDGGLVAWCEDPDRARVQGILIDLPGRACAALGNDLPGFFLWCLETGHITRADYAIDDHDGLLTRDRILECQAAGGLVTRWQGPVREYCNHEPGELAGWTLYLGAREGEAMVRIYDKAAQLGVDGPWVRFEFETKGDLAHALAAEYFEVGAGAVVGQINRRIRFAVPSDTDSNKRRWEACDWWEQLLGSLDQGPALRAGEKVQATVEHMREWVEYQAAPALAAVVAADGDKAWIAELLHKGEDRWRSKHRGAVELAQSEDRAKLRRVRAVRDAVYGVGA